MIGTSVAWVSEDVGSFFRVFRWRLLTYPSPVNISYSWNYGSMSGIFLGAQIVTGLILALHYTADLQLAFNGIIALTRDIEYGWLIRSLHANGASFFFIMVYLHIIRGYFFGSYYFPRSLAWLVGSIILVVLIATAFLGYVLPWGQMSFWAATVITNLFSAVPVFGRDIVELIWGAYAVGGPTLQRLYAIHFLLPFVLAALAAVHIFFLGFSHSSNPLGLKSGYDFVPFHPYFTIKDAVGFALICMFFSYYVFDDVNAFGHPDNFIPANPLVTPPHIVPEWYFLLLYAVLRAIPDKLGGILLFGSAILTLCFLPCFNVVAFRSGHFRYIFSIIGAVLLSVIVLLFWIGSRPVKQPFIIIGQLLTVSYFLLTIVSIPMCGIAEYLLDRYTIR